MQKVGDHIHVNGRWVGGCPGPRRSPPAWTYRLSGDGNFARGSGRSRATAATVEAGQPKVIPSAQGSRTTPSVVAFTAQGERLVGQLARRQAILNPKWTIYSAKP